MLKWLLMNVSVANIEGTKTEGVVHETLLTFEFATFNLASVRAQGVTLKTLLMEASVTLNLEKVVLQSLWKAPTVDETPVRNQCSGM